MTRPLGRALGFGLLAALATFALLRPAVLPDAWVADLVPGMSRGVAAEGGTRARLVSPPEQPPIDDPTLAALERRFVRFAGAVRREASRLVVELPVLVGDDALLVIGTLISKGHLSIADIEDFSRRAPCVVQQIEQLDLERERTGQPAADRAVRGEYDEQTGTWALLGPASIAIAETLSQLAEREPPCGLPPGTRVVYEVMGALGHRFGLPFRAYLVADPPVFSNRDLAGADSFGEGDDASVVLTFTPEATSRLAAWSAERVDRAIAVLHHEDLVASLPVVREPMLEGRAAISVMAGPLAARALADVLSGPPIDLELSIDHSAIATVPPGIDDALRWKVGALLSLLAGLAVALLAYPLARAGTDEPSALASGGRRPLGRLAVTLGGVGLIALAHRVPLPTVELPDDLFRLHALQFGLAPLVTGWLMVELVAALVPRLRARRHSGPARRRSLDEVAVAVGLLLSAAQAHFLLLGFEGRGTYDPASPLAPPPWLPTVAVLVGGTAALGLAALVVGRFGLVNGFAAALVGGLVVQAVDLVGALEAAAPGERLAALAAIALAAIATAAVLRVRRAPATRFRLPTAGVVPLAADGIVSAALVLGWPPVAALGVRPIHLDGGAGRIALVVALALALTVGWSWLACRSALAADAGADARRAFGAALALSIGYVAALYGATLLAARGGPGLELGVITLTALTTATALDLTAEWRARRAADLVAVWPLANPQRFDAIRAVLAERGIACHGRGLHFNSLVPLVSAFVPVTILVPRERVAEATDLVRQLESPDR